MKKKICLLLILFAYSFVYAQSNSKKKILIPDYFVTTWKTDNLGVSNDTSIQIPTIGGGYFYDVDWDNDDIFDEFGITGSITHDFGTIGVYTIQIRGDFPRIYFNNSGDKSKILSIDQWGTEPWTSMRQSFHGCENLAGQASDNPDLSNVTDMGLMFRDATSFNQDISNWDISNVTNLVSAFFNATSFNQDISGWDTGNVINMGAMFFKATSFNQDIGGWNTENIINMSVMFRGATNFNQNIGSWITSNVTDMNSMFGGATNFNQNIGSWITSNVTDMNSMFSGATMFNQDIGDWDTGNVIDMGAMFFNATSFNQDIGSWNISNLETANGMFNGVTLSTANYDALLIGWNVQSLQPNISFSGGNSKYCSGEEARQNMIDNDGWTITDAGYEETCLPDCTVVFDPEDGATGVSINASLTWAEVADATGYKIEIGTESGASDVLNEDLFNVTTYTPTPSWSSGTTYYVAITPYNEVGDAEDDCIETQFTTEIIATAPDCTAVFDPEDGATGVSINASLTWTEVVDATGYKIEIGTEPGTSDVLDEDLLDVTTYIPNPSWLEDTTYYVTITPYNEVGDTEDDCVEIQFTIEIIAAAPNCTEAFDPEDGATGVSVNASLTWQEVANATGYNITIGLSSGGTEIENNNLGNVTNHTPNPAWSQNTTYYVTVTPYNEEGNAINCTETSFTTFEDIFIPNAFTPDNDGLNDTFNIINIDLIYPNYIILIYDRWGNNVYKGKNGWDGISQNNRSLGTKKVMQGTYYVLIILNNSKTIKRTLLVEY